MNNVLDLFLGDPVYDEQNNVIGRDFGIKNIVAIMVVGFIGYSLMSETKTISGKGKMKGGLGPQEGWRKAVFTPIWDIITHGLGYPGRKEWWGLGTLLSPRKMYNSCKDGDYCPATVAIAFALSLFAAVLYLEYYFTRHKAAEKNIGKNKFVKWLGHVAKNKVVGDIGIGVGILALALSFWGTLTAIGTGELNGPLAAIIWLIVCGIAIFIKKS